MSYKDLIRVETKRQELEKLISEECGDGSLMFYGSCRNGFGSKVTSDYDMSFKLDSFKLKMSFVDRKEESQSPLKVLYQVFRVLSKSDPDCEAEFISTAKIPIVTAPNWRGIEIDISYDNFSGIENTELLRTYCAWAPNILPQLEFWVKKWAKANEICGGEKLLFKTYHWYLLTIYYLQQYGWRTLRKYWKNRDRVVPYIQKEFFNPREAVPWKYYNTEVIENWSTDSGTLA